jgi:hypothetical protein
MATTDVDAGILSLGAVAGRDVNISDVNVFHRGNIIQHIAAVYNIQEASAGSEPITASLRDRLKRLLEQRHALFGGREAELQRLDSFLVERPSGYLFLTSQSGFGKTALLANWVNSLQGQHQPICYHFISRNDGNDVAGADFTLRNLCQQLVAFHKLTGQLPSTTDVLRSLYAELLQVPPPEAQRLVVVLDGLDEAVDWELGPDLFPGTLPAGVFVVFSAREIAGRDWTNKLELGTHVEVLTLEAMATVEIARLLSSVGPSVSTWADDPLRLQAVSDISGGDPFYLRYLVEDIRDVPITSIEQLRRYATGNGTITGQRGLKAYLDKWWADVSKVAGEPAVYDLLGYLLVSKGPLTRDELIEISSTDALNGAVFERVIEQTARYVLGDEITGYKFCHSRFRDYIAQHRIKELEQQQPRKALLDYCSRWRENKSHYARAHYAEHLREAGQLDTLNSLVEDPQWFETQMEADPSGDAFRNDVKQAWTLFRSRESEATGSGEAANLGRGLRYALFIASMNSRSIVPPALLKLLVSANVWTSARAIKAALLNPDAEQRAESLALLAAGLGEGDRIPVVRHALEALAGVRRRDAILGVWRELAPILPYALIDAALATIGQILDSPGYAYALTVLLPHVPRAEMKVALLAGALKTARDSCDPRDRCIALATLSDYLDKTHKSDIILEAWTAMHHDPAPEDISRGRWVIYKNPSEEVRVEAIRLLAPHLPEELVQEAYLEALASPSLLFKGWALAALASRLPDVGRRTAMEQCIYILEASAVSPNTVVQFEPASFFAIATQFLGEELLPRAANIIKRILDPEERARALKEISPRLSEAILREIIQDASWTLDAMVILAPSLHEPLRNDVMQKTLHAAWEWENLEERARALTAMLPLLPEPPRNQVMQEAVATALQIQDEPAGALEMSAAMLGPLAKLMSQDFLKESKLEVTTRRETALVAIAEFLPPDEKKDVLLEAMHTVTKIRDEYRQARAVAALVRSLPEPQRTDQLPAAFEALQKVEDDYFRGLVLAELAPILESGLLLEGLKLAKLMEHPTRKSEALAAFLPRLEQAIRNEVVQEILALTDKMDSAEDQAGVFTTLIPLLDEPLRSNTSQKASGAIKSIGDSRFDVLLRLVPLLPNDLRLEVLVGRNLTFEQISELAPQLPQESKDQLLSQALEAASDMPDLYERAHSLGLLCPHLESSRRAGVAKRALDALELATPSDSRRRAIALSILAPHIAYEMVGEALLLVSSLHKAHERADAILALLPHLIEPSRGNAIHRALEAAGAIDFPTGRAATLVKLVPFLPDSLLVDALVIARRITQPYSRRDALAALAGRLAVLPHSDLFPIWNELIEGLSERSRPDLLWDLVALAPLIGHLGDVQSRLDIVTAIQDIGHRWP